MFLADYFAIVRSSSEREVGCAISCRIPPEDHEHLPFPEGIELFALPTGWTTERTHQPPRVHTVTNTKLNGSRYYSVFFTFYTKTDEDDYDPTSLVLIASHSYLQQLKHALFMLFDHHSKKSDDLERLLAHILVQQVPTPGWKTTVRYNLGDRMTQHAIQAQRYPTIDATGDCVAKLLNWLGPRNLMTIVILILTDHKIALFGKSFSALSDASRALIALTYPMCYPFSYIPVMPVSMSDYLDSPVPFLCGVHTEQWEEKRGDCPDVVGCDIDGGGLVIPDNIYVPKLPDQIDKELVHRLTLAAKPALVAADLAFPPPKIEPSPPCILDKEVRAIILLALVKVLHNYRSALQFSRIHPIVQVKLGRQEFLQSNDSHDFKNILCSSQAFQIFIQDRGPSYRPLDLFDKLVDEFNTKADYDTKSMELSREVRTVCDEFLRNEMPKWDDRRDLSECTPAELFNLSTGLAKFEKEPFPDLSHMSVMSFHEDLMKRSPSIKYQAEKESSMRITPPETKTEKKNLDTNSQRHLDVLDQFIQALSSEKTLSTVKKHFPGACRSLKTRLIRSRLLEILINWSGNEGDDPKRLTHPQFEYIYRLIDLSLKNSTGNKDEFYVASTVIAISAELYRKVETDNGTTNQYINSQIQDHPIWCSFDFWIEYFHIELQVELTMHYRKEMASDESIRRSNSVIMSVVGKQLAEWQNKTQNQRKLIGEEEEGIVFNRLVQLICQMIPLLIPFHTAKIMTLRRNMRNSQGPNDGNSSIITASNVESDSEDEGFSDNPNQLVHRFIERIQDSLCISCNIHSSRSSNLQTLLTCHIQLTCDNYEQLRRALARIPKMKRPADHSPQLLDRERIKRQLAVHLINDSREFGVYGSMHSPNEVYLPAEGTLFLTNYRVIFHGNSIELEHLLVIRAAPLCSIIKVKPNTATIASPGLSYYHLEIRTATAEYFHIVFTNEVTEDERRQFRESLVQLRFPEDNSPLSVFAFANNPKTISKTIQFKSKTGFSNIMKPKRNGKVGELPTISENITKTLQNKSTSERYKQRSSRNGDWDRLGMKCAPLKESKANELMLLCKTYPAITVQPATVSDTQLRGVSKAFKRGRYPSIVWKHTNGAVLARSEAIAGNVIGRLLRRRRFDEIDDVGLQNPTKDLDAWIKAVAALTTKQKVGSLLHRSSMYGGSVVSVASATSGFVRGFDTFRQSTLTRARHGTLPSPTTNNQGSRLVIFVDRSVGRKARPDPTAEVEFLSIDTPSADEVRDSFKDICKQVAQPNKNGTSLGDIGRWYALVQSALHCASAAADLISKEGVSVYFALEGGWDFTAILSSLVQLIIDPTYRTVDGFHTLVQREFISFGHRFSTNGVQRDYQAPSPFFILFLDCVFQLIDQNCCSFQFNVQFLETLGYHVFSGRFSTFLLDSEHDRIESLIMFDSSKNLCFWSYVTSMLDQKKCHMLNKLYCPRGEGLFISPEIEFMRVFSFFQSSPMSSPSPNDNVHGEISLDVDEDKDLRQNIIYGGVDNIYEFVLQRPIQEKFVTNLYVNVDDGECAQTRDRLRLKSSTQFINSCRRVKGDIQSTEQDPVYESVREENNVYEGYLFKQGNNFKRWKQYYFAIQDNKVLVQYEETHGQRSCSKEIPLNEITFADLAPLVDPRTLPRGFKPNSHFQVKMKNRKYQFIAANSSAARKWVDTIRDCIDC